VQLFSLDDKKCINDSKDRMHLQMMTTMQLRTTIEHKDWFSTPKYHCIQEAIIDNVVIDAFDISQPCMTKLLQTTGTLVMTLTES